MKIGELLSSLFINLQCYIKSNINIKGKSLLKIVALSLIPIEGLEMSTLSSRLGLDNSTVTRLVIGLEKNGWVRRRSSVLDKRVVLVTLTKDGLSMQQNLEQQFEFMGEKIEKDLSLSNKLNVTEVIANLNWILLKSVVNKK